jgi:ElaA protein
MRWNFILFDKLSLEELYSILQIRERVFALEQKCFYQDLDDLDQKAMHILGLEGSKLVAYARVTPRGTAYPDGASFGRVLVAEEHRGKGLAHEMVKEVLEFIQKENPGEKIIISAQAHLEKLYASFGFKSVGAPYDDAGILHIKMELIND